MSMKKSIIVYTETTKQLANEILIKICVKKAIGEGKQIQIIIDEYGMKVVQKILLKIVRNEEEKSPFYYKCLDVMISLETSSREEFPELWI